MKDPTQLYNFNYFINTYATMYNEFFLKENQFKRKSTRFIQLELQTLQVKIINFYASRLKMKTIYTI
jgi:hypothetical protein